jgi:hypothetical protein
MGLKPRQVRDAVGNLRVHNYFNIVSLDDNTFALRTGRLQLGSKQHWSKGSRVHHPKKLGAARRRRDAGERPFALDNDALREAGERTNPLPVQEPNRPPPGTNKYLVWQELRAGPKTIEKLARDTGLSKEQVRRTMNHLRGGAHGIKRIGACTFAIAPRPRRPAA